MAKSSFWGRMLLAGDDAFAVEQPVTATAGHPYFDLPVALGVFNPSSSNKLVYIHQINAKPLTTANATNAIVQIMRITASSTPFETLTAFKLDSNNSDLPSQVLAHYLPTSVTKTANSQLRRLALQAQFHPTTALAALIARVKGDARSNLDTSEIFGETDADTTGYILREGQGISLEYVDGNLGLNAGFSFTVVAKVVATGACYRFNRVVEPRAWHNASGALFTLLNGASSGVVLDVQRIQIREIGTAEPAMLTYEMLDNLDSSAEDAEIVPFDSTVPTIPSGVLCKQSAMAQRAGIKMGALITQPVLRRVSLEEPAWTPGLAGLQFGRRGLYERDGNWGSTGMLLRPGQGVGVRRINASARCCHDVYVHFSVSDMPISHNHPTIALGGMP